MGPVGLITKLPKPPRHTLGPRTAQQLVLHASSAAAGRARFGGCTPELRRTGKQRRRERGYLLHTRLGGSFRLRGSVHVRWPLLLLLASLDNPRPNNHRNSVGATRETGENRSAILVGVHGQEQRVLCPTLAQKLFCERPQGKEIPTPYGSALQAYGRVLMLRAPDKNVCDW